MGGKNVVPDNMSSESLHWHFGGKNPTLAGVLCLEWLFPKTRSARTATSFFITSPLSTQSHTLSSPSPEIHQCFPKSNILGVPRFKGPTPPAPGCFGSLVAFALAVILQGTCLQQGAPRDQDNVQ